MEAQDNSVKLTVRERVKKFTDFILLLAMVLAGLAFAVLLFGWPLFFRGEITEIEIRFWVAAGLFYSTMITLSIARLYNAIVANSKLVLSNSRKLDKFVSELKKLVSDTSSTSRAYVEVSKNLNKLVARIEDYTVELLKRK